jgi:hypothetical protein
MGESWFSSEVPFGRMTWTVPPCPMPTIGPYRRFIGGAQLALLTDFLYREAPMACDAGKCCCKQMNESEGKP